MYNDVLCTHIVENTQIISCKRKKVRAIEWNRIQSDNWSVVRVSLMGWAVNNLIARIINTESEYH